MPDPLASTSRTWRAISKSLIKVCRNEMSSKTACVTRWALQTLRGIEMSITLIPLRVIEKVSKSSRSIATEKRRLWNKMSTRVRKIAMLQCKLTLAANIQRNALRVAAVSELIQFSILTGMATQEIFSTWQRQDRRLALTIYDLKRVCATIQPTQTSKHNSLGFSILMRLHWKVLYRSLKNNSIVLAMNKTCTTAQ